MEDHFFYWHWFDIILVSSRKLVAEKIIVTVISIAVTLWACCDLVDLFVILNSIHLAFYIFTGSGFIFIILCTTFRSIANCSRILDLKGCNGLSAYVACVWHCMTRSAAECWMAVRVVGGWVGMLCEGWWGNVLSRMRWKGDLMGSTNISHNDTFGEYQIQLQQCCITNFVCNETFIAQIGCN